MIKDFIFLPLSILWSWIYRLRRALFRANVFSSHNLELPTISVGNISFGGTGKTPFVLWAANFLNNQNRKIAVLTRGYKGELENSHGILQSEKFFTRDPDRYGDEASLLAGRMQNGAVIVGKKRAENFEYYQKQNNFEALVLDDGFQHLKIQRDLNIVLFDALLPLSQYYTAPKGYLREGASSLTDADVLVFTRADQVPDSKIRSLLKMFSPYLSKDIHVVKARYKMMGVYDQEARYCFPVSELNGKRVLAVAGIGSPDSFFRMVSDLGASLVDRISFPDHHKYTLEDISIIKELASEKNAIILSSEKDVVKLMRFTAQIECFYIPVELDVLDGEEELKKRIMETVI